MLTLWSRHLFALLVRASTKVNTSLMSVFNCVHQSLVGGLNLAQILETGGNG